MAPNWNKMIQIQMCASYKSYMLEYSTKTILLIPQTQLACDGFESSLRWIYRHFRLGPTRLIFGNPRASTVLSTKAHQSLKLIFAAYQVNTCDFEWGKYSRDLF